MLLPSVAGTIMHCMSCCLIDAPTLVLTLHADWSCTSAGASELLLTSQCTLHTAASHVPLLTGHDSLSLWLLCLMLLSCILCFFPVPVLARKFTYPE